MPPSCDLGSVPPSQKPPEGGQKGDSIADEISARFVSLLLFSFDRSLCLLTSISSLALCLFYHFIRGRHRTVYGYGRILYGHNTDISVPYPYDHSPELRREWYGSYTAVQHLNPMPARSETNDVAAESSFTSSSIFVLFYALCRYYATWWLYPETANPAPQTVLVHPMPVCNSPTQPKRECWLWSPWITETDTFRSRSVLDCLFNIDCLFAHLINLFLSVNNDSSDMLMIHEVIHPKVLEHTVFWRRIVSSCVCVGPWWRIEARVCETTWVCWRWNFVDVKWEICGDC